MFRAIQYHPSIVAGVGSFNDSIDDVVQARLLVAFMIFIVLNVLLVPIFGVFKDWEGILLVARGGGIAYDLRTVEETS